MKVIYIGDNDYDIKHGNVYEVNRWIIDWDGTKAYIIYDDVKDKRILDRSKFISVKTTLKKIFENGCLNKYIE